MERLLERQHRWHPNHDNHLRTPLAQIQRSSPPVHDKRHLYSQRNGELPTAHQQDPRRRLAEDGTHGAKQHPRIPQQQVRYEHDDARCVGEKSHKSSQELTNLVLIAFQSGTACSRKTVSRYGVSRPAFSPPGSVATRTRTRISVQAIQPQLAISYGASWKGRGMAM